MSEKWNPYEAPQLGDNENTVSAIRISRFGYPEGDSECSLFTYSQFAELFERKLHEACVPLNIPTIRVTETSDVPPLASTDEFTTTISGTILRLTDYQITSWNRFRKWFLPMLGYHYRAAGFEIVGQISSPQHDTIPFRLFRTFNRGGLAFEMPQGEKTNMLIGMDSEAMRVIALALGKSAKSPNQVSRGPFWLVLICVPLLAATVIAFLAYTFDPWLGVDRTIRAGLAFIAAGFLTAAFLPASTYSDPRAAFFYRITAAKSSLVLRAFPAIFGLLAAALLVASYLYGEG